MNNLEAEENGDEEDGSPGGLPTAEDIEALMALGEGASMTDILATQQRFKKFGNGGRPWRPRAGGEQRRDGGQQRAGGARGDRLPGAGQAQEMQCINCGKPGHKAAECRAPKADLSERPCFKCGKPGHMSRDCKAKPGPAVAGKNVGTYHFGCLEVEPVPSSCNTFAALFDDDHDFPEAELDEHDVSRVKPGLKGPRPKAAKPSQKELAKARKLKVQADDEELAKALAANRSIKLGASTATTTKASTGNLSSTSPTSTSK